MHRKTSFTSAFLALAIALVALAPAGSAQAPALAIVLTQTGTSTQVTEGLATVDTYTVALNRAPVGPLTVALTFAAGDFTATPTSVAFSPADTAAKTITVASIEDALPEGTESITVTHTTQSTVASENGRAATLVVKVVDNDAGIGLARTGTTSRVTEAAGTARQDTIDVSLGSRPGAGVTLTFSSNDQVTFSPAKLIFTNSDWNVAKALTVTAVDDRVDDELDGLITVLATSTGAYNGLTASHEVTVVDNDNAGYIFNALARNALPPAFALDEAAPGTTATFTLKLNSQPTSDVVVDFAHNAAQVTVSPASLTFTSASTGATSWSTARTVTVTVLNDAFDEAGTSTTPPCPALPPPGGSCNLTYAVMITPTVASTDPKYATVPGPLTANVRDNDVSGYVFAPQGGAFGAAGALPAALTLTEAAGAAQQETYSIKLLSQPTSPVTVNLAGTSQVTVAPASLSFTASGPDAWDQPHVVTVTAVNDAVDEADSHASSVTQTAVSSDPQYASIPSPVPATLTDDDTAGLYFAAGPQDTCQVDPAPAPEASCIIVREGALVGEAGYEGDVEVFLLSQPTAPVVVTLSPENPAEVTLSATTVTIQSADWDDVVRVSVRAVNDAIAEPSTEHSFVITGTTNAGYGDFTGEVPVVVLDDEGKGILDAGNGLLVIESNVGDTEELTVTDTYTLRLVENPTTPVTITITADDGLLRFNGAASLVLTFQPTTLPGDVGAPGSTPWNVAQTVRVSAPLDGTAQGLHADLILHALAGGGPAYAGASIPALSAAIVDSDKGVLIELDDGLSFTEGGSDSFTVALSVEPESSVAIELTPAAGIALSESTVYFGSEDWDIPQTVTVTAPADDVDEDDAQLAIGVTVVGLPGDGYHGLAVDDLDVALLDDDTAGITSDAASSYEIAEGDSVQYTVVLSSQPAGEVTIDLSSTGDVEATPASVTFGIGTWDVPQTITLTAIDDDIAEGDRSDTVAQVVATTDAAYDVALPPIGVLIDEDDVAGFVLVDADSVTVPEFRDPVVDSYTIALTSEPVDNVLLTLAFTGAEVQASPSPLTFSPDDWDVPQTVTVQAVNDFLVEALETFPVAHAVSTSDAAYGALAIPDVLVTVTDNDVANLKRNVAAGLAEGEAGRAFTFRLTAQPSADVAIDILPGADLSFATTALTFTPTNWETLQSIIVTATDDADVEGDESAHVQYTLASSDALFDGLVFSDDVPVKDNDLAAIRVTATGDSTTVSEAGTTDKLSLRLASMPTSDVVVTLFGDGHVRPLKASVTFTAADWNLVQQVTVRAIDDAIVEGAHTGTIGFTVSSADAAYNGLVVPSLTVSIIDND
jgi:large repetitive protein